MSAYGQSTPKASGGRIKSGQTGTLPGHVTPTFGLSPGRGSTATPGGVSSSIASRSTLLGECIFADRKAPMPTTSSPFNSNPMMFRQLGSNNHSMFGEFGDTSMPPLLNLSEFPSLMTRGAGDQATTTPPLSSSKPYVGMVKQPIEKSEFTMSSKDFPALPGSSTNGSPTAQAPATPGQKKQSTKKTIQTSPDVKLMYIPPTMISDQYGVIGLLSAIRMADSNPSLVSLALGQDLTALGLNLNAPGNLFTTFAGPWADAPCRPQDVYYNVPPEYHINTSIKDKLAPLRLSRYKEDLLFYLFYCCVGDVYQIAAAAELYNRGWRYHKEEKLWVTMGPGMPIVEKTPTYERGTYYYFDAPNWRKVAKEFYLDYSKLEGRPQLPANVKM